MERIMDARSHHVRLKSEEDRSTDISIATYLTDRMYPAVDAVCQRTGEPEDLTQDPEVSSLYAASR